MADCSEGIEVVPLLSGLNFVMVGCSTVVHIGDGYILLPLTQCSSLTGMAHRMSTPMSIRCTRTLSSLVRGNPLRGP